MSAVKIPCPHCPAVLNSPKELPAGQLIECKKCKHTFPYDPAAAAVVPSIAPLDNPSPRKSGAHPKPSRQAPSRSRNVESQESYVEEHDEFVRTRGQNPTMLTAVLGAFFGCMVLGAMLGFALSGPSQETLDKLAAMKKKKTAPEKKEPEPKTKTTPETKTAQPKTLEVRDSYLKAIEETDKLALALNKRLEDEFFPKIPTDKPVPPDVAKVWQQRIADVLPKVQATKTKSQEAGKLASDDLSKIENALKALEKKDEERAAEFNEQATAVQQSLGTFNVATKKAQAWEGYFTLVNGLVDGTGKTYTSDWVGRLNVSRTQLRAYMKMWAKASPHKLEPDQVALARFPDLAEPKKVEPKDPKKTEPKKIEPKKTEPKKTEPKKTEPKKTEPKNPPRSVPTLKDATDVVGVAYSFDGNVLATRSQPSGLGVIQVWDPKTGALEKQIDKVRTPGRFMDLALSTDGTKVASLVTDDRNRIYHVTVHDTKTGKVLKEWQTQRRRPEVGRYTPEVVFSNDGKYLFVQDNMYCVRFEFERDRSVDLGRGWGLQLRGQSLYSEVWYEPVLNAAIVTSRSRRREDKFTRVRIFDPGNTVTAARAISQPYFVKNYDVSPDRKTLYLGCASQTEECLVKIDLRTGRESKTPLPRLEKYSQLFLAKDGQRAVILFWKAEKGGKYTVLDTSQKKTVLEKDLPVGSTAIERCPDRKTLVVALGKGKGVAYYDILSGKKLEGPGGVIALARVGPKTKATKLGTVLTQARDVVGLAYSLKGEVLATRQQPAKEKASLQVWDAKTDELKATVKDVPTVGRFVSLAISTDQTKIASLFRDEGKRCYNITVHDIKTGKLAKTWTINNSAGDNPKIQFSLDDSHVFIEAEGYFVQIDYAAEKATELFGKWKANAPFQVLRSNVWYVPTLDATVVTMRGPGRKSEYHIYSVGAESKLIRKGTIDGWVWNMDVPNDSKTILLGCRNADDYWALRVDPKTGVSSKSQLPKRFGGDKLYLNPNAPILAAFSWPQRGADIHYKSCRLGSKKISIELNDLVENVEDLQRCPDRKTLILARAKSGKIEFLDLFTSRRKGGPGKRVPVTIAKLTPDNVMKKPPVKTKWETFAAKDGRFAISVPTKLQPDTGKEMPLTRKYEDPNTNIRYRIIEDTLPAKFRTEKVPDGVLDALAKALTKKGKNVQLAKTTRNGVPGRQLTQTIGDGTQEMIFYLLGKDRILLLSAEYRKGVDNQDAMKFIDSVRFDPKVVPVAKKKKSTTTKLSLRPLGRLKVPAERFIRTRKRDRVFISYKVTRPALYTIDPVNLSTGAFPGISVLAISSQGNLYAAHGKSGCGIIDVKKKKLVHKLKDVRGWVGGFSKDDDYLAIGESAPAVGKNKKPRLFVVNVKTGEVEKVLTDHEMTIHQVAFDDEGNLVSLSRKKVIRYDAKTWKKLAEHQLTADKGGQPWGGLLRNGKYYYEAQPGGFKLYETKTGKLYHYFGGRDKAANRLAGCVTISPDEKFLVSGGGRLVNNDSVQVWTMPGKRRVLELKKVNNGEAVYDVYFCKDGTRLVSCGNPRNRYIVSVWGFQTK